MSKTPKSISDTNINFKEMRKDKHDFSGGINIKTDQWSNWGIRDSIQVKLKWNWLNDENNLIMQIHDKQALRDEKNPDENHVYYVHLEDPFKNKGEEYDFAIKEINITGSYPPEKRRHLIKEVNDKTGLLGKQERNTNAYYVLKQIMPALVLINKLGAELSESDFYEIQEKKYLPEIEKNAGIKCYGILPETLMRVNKFHAPYTYFFDEGEKMYLLKAVGFINMYSAKQAKKADKRLISFKEKLFISSNVFVSIDRIYNNSVKKLQEKDAKHTLTRHFKYDKNRLYAIGMKLFDAKKYDASIEYFKGAVKLDPFFEPAWIKFGETYGILKQWENGVPPLNKAIDINPFNPTSYDYRGSILLMQGFVNDAYNDLKQAILLDNKGSGHYNMLALICIAMDNNTEALKHYSSAIKYSLRKKGELYAKRAVVCYNLALYEDCITDCDAGLKLNPGNEKAIEMRKKALNKTNITKNPIISFKPNYDPKKLIKDIMSDIFPNKK